MGNVASERSRTVDLRLEPRLAISRLHGLLAISRLHDFTFHITPCLVTSDHMCYLWEHWGVYSDSDCKDYKLASVTFSSLSES